MNRSVSKILIAAALLLAGGFAFGQVAFAQNSTCNVTNVQIRHNIVITNGSGDSDGDGETNFQEEFMIDSLQPFFYLDVSTTGCVDGDEVHDMEISLTEADDGAPNPFTLIPDFVDDAVNDIQELNSFDVQVPSNDFTLAYLAGEDECEGNGDPDCDYHVEIWDSNSSEEHFDHFTYSCDVTCDTDWVFKGFLPFGTNHPEDNPGVAPPPNNDNVNGELSEEYLAPLPGLANNPVAGIKGFLQSLFNVGIVVAGILAILMVVIGAITYLSTDSISNTEHGVSMMTNAVLGLILALSAWVIINTINPELAGNLSITIPKVTLGNYDFASSGVVAVPNVAPGETPDEGSGSNSVCKDPNVNRNPGQCTNCQPLPSTIGLTSGAANGHNQTTPQLANKLVALQQATAGTNWVVTEGYPPSRDHCAHCHYLGTCVDADFTFQPTPQQVKAFIEAAKNVGLDADWEVKTQAEFDALIAIGLKKKKDVLLLGNWISGSHFSIYDR